MLLDQLKPNIIVRGPIFPEPVQVIVAIPMGTSVKLVGKGLNTNQVHEPILSAEQLAQLVSTPEKEPFDGDPLRFRLGIEALRLGLAYEYDPYFSLSIARVDPLPHQLEAVYDYFLTMPRIRFLLADDPGAGKTIMAGLLLKELKIRGLVKRTLIITPASLSFQWQREMKEKFREQFEVIRSDVLRANYGMNPWQERNQVVTSISWVSRIEDAKDSLLRSRWDLIIVDEAHKMAAYSADKKTLAYRLGESLSGMTDHFLLMTATPHKGDPENFCLFLELLDRDVYGNVKSLEEAMRRNYAPFYLRRTKEALVSFPDPETGQVKKLFTDRFVHTASFDLDGEEYDFYDALTRYVEDQSIKAAQEDSPRSRALSFTMAMLQRRFASSVYAVRRSLERMRDKRRKILDDPRDYLRKQMEVPDDLDDLPEEEREDYIEQIENAAISFDPTLLKEEILQIGRLIDQARALEHREIESKLVKLKKVLAEQDILQAYQNFLSKLAVHYSSSGSGHGSEIYPYIAYVRPGMSQGGENYPNCTMAGRIPQAVWVASSPVPGGYIVEPTHLSNPGDYLFMATGAGTTSSSLGPGFWCQTPGCHTSSDNGVPSWKNVGAGAAGNSALIVWPGPKGQFGTGSESQKYSDNGYLSTWNSPNPVGTGDGTGYIASMTAFLAGLNASFPWTISSHTGPPGNVNEAYADSEALLAAAQGVGFGMQSVSLADTVSSGWPATREDWADNFATYLSSTPVRHLQVEIPGSPVQGAGYAINTITVNPSTWVATVNCASASVGTCSDFADVVAITGNSTAALNSTWVVACGLSCATDTITFNVPVGTGGGSGGTVWEPGYFPTVGPFANSHDSTSLEMWECILDYTYGTTTTSGCGTGITGPDSNYQSAISGVVP